MSRKSKAMFLIGAGLIGCVLFDNFAYALSVIVDAICAGVTLYGIWSYTQPEEESA